MLAHGYCIGHYTNRTKSSQAKQSILLMKENQIKTCSIPIETKEDKNESIYLVTNYLSTQHQ